MNLFGKATNFYNNIFGIKPQENLIKSNSNVTPIITDNKIEEQRKIDKQNIFKNFISAFKKIPLDINGKIDLYTKYSRDAKLTHYNISRDQVISDIEKMQTLTDSKQKSLIVDKLVLDFKNMLSHFQNAKTQPDQFKSYIQSSTKNLGYSFISTEQERNDLEQFLNLWVKKFCDAYLFEEEISNDMLPACLIQVDQLKKGNVYITKQEIIPNRDLEKKNVIDLYDKKCKTNEWENSLFCEISKGNKLATILGSTRFVPQNNPLGDDNADGIYNYQSTIAFILVESIHTFFEKSLKKYNYKQWLYNEKIIQEMKNNIKAGKPVSIADLEKMLSNLIDKVEILKQIVQKTPFIQNKVNNYIKEKWGMEIKFLDKL